MTRAGERLLEIMHELEGEASLQQLVELVAERGVMKKTGLTQQRLLDQLVEQGWLVRESDTLVGGSRDRYILT